MVSESKGKSQATCRDRWLHFQACAGSELAERSRNLPRLRRDGELP